MSEQRTQHNVQKLRRWLLATASALALAGSILNVVDAADVDADHPVLWIEIGGQLTRMDDQSQRLAPPFFTSLTHAGFDSPIPFEKAPLYSIDENGKVSFQPSDSGWILSASIRYGRNGKNVDNHQQTNNLFGYLNIHNPSGARHRYENVSASSSETHEILDFTIGKDVGLGVFGSAGSSILGGGIRFAQFHYKSSVAVYADPDYTWTQVSGPPQKYFHNYDAKAKNRMSFTGVGPSLSWDASVPLHGNIQNGQITFDWGLNGAVLFGRQKSQGFNEAKGVLDTGVNISFLNLFYHTTHYTRPHSHSRSRMVTVPNIGAMAGISFRYGAAKISLGYNADLFFGAMDGGIDTARKENVGFYGPFAAISVGLGG
jgi:hypothetical protein